MGKARRNPFRGVYDTISEMNRLQQQWMSGYDPTANSEEQPRTHATAWIPPTDIYADGNDLVIRCELSGVAREDVDISISAGVLIISGQRESRLDEENTSFLIRERFYGAFRRSITLSEDVDEGKIGASFHDGLLEVTIQGGAIAPEQRSIKIQGS